VNFPGFYMPVPTGYGSALGSPNPRLGFPFQVVGAAGKS